MDRDELQEKYGEETDLLFLGTDAKEFDSAIIGISEDMNAPTHVWYIQSKNA